MRNQKEETDNSILLQLHVRLLNIFMLKVFQSMPDATLGWIRIVH